MDETLSAAAFRAAAAIRDAEVIVVGAGAGMGVDSGLPDFRGDQGFWKAYPPYERLGISFMDAANPEHFKSDPEFGWGFYGHRLALYRATAPHAGFGILRRWVMERRLPFFVYTSNVDGHFQAAGFHPEAIVEIHGSIHHLQCSEQCTEDIWENRESVEVDESNMRARNVLLCPRCGAVARPNILMFGDLSWAPYRSFAQKSLFDAFLASQRGRRIVAIELGAGTSIPSVRRMSEGIAQLPGATLVRVNPREADAPEGAISIEAGALAGLQAIDAELARKREASVASIEVPAAREEPGKDFISLPPRADLPIPGPGERPFPGSSATLMYEGPWLDRLFPIHLPGGRMASVVAFSVLASNVGILEGGMYPECNADQRDKIVALANSCFGGPIVMIEPTIVPIPNISKPGRKRERLPWMACMAHLLSSPLDADMVSSELTLVWWQDSFSLPLPAEIERAAASLKWEHQAKDVDVP